VRVDPGDLRGGGIGVVAHRLVEADDDPADLVARAIPRLVAPLPVITAVPPRRAWFNTEGDVGPRDVDVDLLTIGEHERVLATGGGRPACSMARSSSRSSSLCAGPS
jgi:hypothetical protein